MVAVLARSFEAGKCVIELIRR
jgi:hypothetical protein